MTTSELAVVEAVLLKVLPDPMGFAQRVLGELAERLMTVPPSQGAGVVPGYESGAHEALADRHVLLAAALGACECWGEDAGCPGCGGEGSAGWVPPDPELYAEYVAPAVRRTASEAPPTHTGPAEPAIPAHRADPAGTNATDQQLAKGEAR